MAEGKRTEVCRELRRLDLIRFRARGVVDVRPLISARFDLGDGLRGLQRAADPGVLKVLLTAGAGA